MSNLQPNKFGSLVFNLDEVDTLASRYGRYSIAISNLQWNKKVMESKLETLESNIKIPMENDYRIEFAGLLKEAIKKTTDVLEKIDTVAYFYNTTPKELDAELQRWEDATDDLHGVHLIPVLEVEKPSFTLSDRELIHIERR